MFSDEDKIIYEDEYQPVSLGPSADGWRVLYRTVCPKGCTDFHHMVWLLPVICWAVVRVRGIDIEKGTERVIRRGRWSRSVQAMVIKDDYVIAAENVDCGSFVGLVAPGEDPHSVWERNCSGIMPPMEE